MEAIDRRTFLNRGVRSAVALGFSLPLGRAQLACAQSDSAAEGAIQSLREPIVLRAGETLAHRRFRLTEYFRWTPTLAAIYCAAPDVTIRDVELIGAADWQPRWNTYVEPEQGPTGIPAGLCGIRLQRAHGAKIENVRIEGFPGSGIDGFGLADGVIRDVRVTRCFQGVTIRQYEENPRLLIERVAAHDLWGPGPGKWPGVGGPPSRLRPGGFVGSDGVVCHSLRDAVVRDCTALGEQFGSFKLVNPQRVQVSGLRGVHLAVQGTSDLEWKIDKEPSRDTVVRDCLFDKSLGSGELVDVGNCIQVSWNVLGLRIENCTLIGAGHNGHGIQFAVNAHGTVVGCTFDGFNGTRGTHPAHAVEVLDRSSINEDFANVNVFRNQRRILLRS